MREHSRHPVVARLVGVDAELFSVGWQVPGHDVDDHTGVAPLRRWRRGRDCHAVYCRAVRSGSERRGRTTIARLACWLTLAKVLGTAATLGQAVAAAALPPAPSIARYQPTTVDRPGTASIAAAIPVAQPIVEGVRWPDVSLPVVVDLGGLPPEWQEHARRGMQVW